MYSGAKHARPTPRRARRRDPRQRQRADGRRTPRSTSSDDDRGSAERRRPTRRATQTQRPRQRPPARRGTRRAERARQRARTRRTPAPQRARRATSSTSGGANQTTAADERQQDGAAQDPRHLAPIATRRRLDAAVPAVALLVGDDGLEQVAAAEVGPERLGDPDLGVGDLPEQEVADAHLAARADQQVGIGLPGRVEQTRRTRCSSSVVGGDARARSRGAPRRRSRRGRRS